MTLFDLPALKNALTSAKCIPEMITLLLLTNNLKRHK